jgi:hypothetical protein
MVCADERLTFMQTTLQMLRKSCIFVTLYSQRVSKE